MVLETNFIHSKWVLLMVFDKGRSQLGPDEWVEITSMQMFLLRPLREGARDEGLLLVLDPGSLCEAESGK